MSRNIKAGILNPANVLTILRILLVPLYMWLFSRGLWITAVCALVVFIIAAITDLYDGKLARSRKEVTKFGKFLDPLADKFLVIGALVQFWTMGLVNIWLVGVIVVRDIWVTIMRIMAIKKGKELKTSRDAKLKTTIQLTVVITIIVFTGGRMMAINFGYMGPWINLSWFRIFYNGLVSIAVIFTVYSWFKYIFKIRPAKA